MWARKEIEKGMDTGRKKEEREMGKESVMGDNLANGMVGAVEGETEGINHSINRGIPWGACHIVLMVQKPRDSSKQISIQVSLPS